MHQIPSSFPPVFSGDRLVVYGVLKASENESEGEDNEVRLEGMLGSGEKVEHLVEISSPPIAVENKGYAVLHQLAAKSFIQENQDGYSEMNDGQEFEEAKRSIISFSKTANVVSKLTSFVAVDKESNQPVTGPLRKRFVPSYQYLAFSMAIPRRDVVAGGSGAKMKGGGFGVKTAKKVPLSHYGAALFSSSPVYCRGSITGDYDRHRDRLSSGDEDSNTAAASAFHARKDSNQPVTGPLRKHFVPSYQDLACSMAMPRRRVVAGGGGAMMKGEGVGVKTAKSSPPSYLGAALPFSCPASYIVQCLQALLQTTIAIVIVLVLVMKTVIQLQCLHSMPEKRVVLDSAVQSQG